MEKMIYNFVMCIGAATVVWFALWIAYMAIKIVITIFESSKYCYMFMTFLAKNHNKKLLPEEERRFIGSKDYVVIEKTNEAIKILTDKIQFNRKKYSELRHPLFIWNGRMFARSSGNDVIDIETSQAGKIPEGETVTEVEMNFSMLMVIESINFANVLKERLDRCGWNA